MTGRRRLLAVIQILGGREVALRVHVHESNVSRWAAGAWRPCRRAQLELEAHCRIPREAWDLDVASTRQRIQ
jgi:hypothetical protein